MSKSNSGFNSCEYFLNYLLCEVYRDGDSALPRVVALYSCNAPSISSSYPALNPIVPGMAENRAIHAVWSSPLAHNTPKAAATPVRDRIWSPIPSLRNVKGDSPYSGIIESLGLIGSCGLFSRPMKLIIRSISEKSNVEGSNLPLLCVPRTSRGFEPKISLEESHKLETIFEELYNNQL